MRITVVAALALLGLVLPTTASATRVWHRVSAPGVNSATSDPQPQLVGGQTPGYAFVEHVRTGPNTSSYRRVLLDAATQSRVLRVDDPPTSNWTSLTENPAFVVEPGSGLQHLLFGGLRSVDSADPRNAGHLHSASTDAGGAAWVLDSLAQTQNPLNGIDEFAVGATSLEPGNQQMSFVWTGPGGTIARFGLDGSAETVLQAGCCTYDPGVAILPTGGASRDYETWALWYSQGPGITGIRTQRVFPTASAPEWVPGSSDTAHALGLQPRQHIRATIVGYMAYCAGYPACTRVNMYNVRSHHVCHVAAGRSLSSPSVESNGPNAGGWVSWVDGQQVRIAMPNLVTCSDDSAQQAIDPPKGTQSINGSVFVNHDVLWANLTVNGVSSMWTTPIQPEPIVVVPAAVRAGAIASIRITAAGGIAPRRASLRLFGTTWRPTSRGTFAVRVPATTKAGVYRSQVKLPGALPAPIALRVRR